MYLTQKNEARRAAL